MYHYPKYANEMITVRSPIYGMRLGECRDCGKSVILSPPYMDMRLEGEEPYYIFRCENPECCNFDGMEAALGHETQYIDFINWDYEAVEPYTEHRCKIIPFPVRRSSYERKE